MRPTLLLAAFVLVATGCGGPTQSSDPTKARTVLIESLDAWKAGKRLDDMRTGSPAVHVIDQDWMLGRKLLAYELVGDAKRDGPGTAFTVKLTLDGGKPAGQPLTYRVFTSPSLSVARTESEPGKPND